MRYVSTRGTAPVLGFRDATLAGLASDGGLYVPETWPVLDRATIAGLAGLSYAQTAAIVMQPFIGDALEPGELQALCDAAYGRFSHAAGDAVGAGRLRSLAARTVPRPPHWRSRTSRCNCWDRCSNAS